MKKLLLSLVFAGVSAWGSAQVICAVQSPANIAGNYNFTWGDPANGDWMTPDFLVPGTFVQGDLVMVNDGTPGTNATYGNLLAEEGCNASPANAYLGKIAILRRNTCEFGKKAYEAQQAGAIGVIIVNRDPDVIEMGGGVDGVNVTIPVVMVNNADGQTMIDEMANGPVNVFLGNKAGLYGDDAGILKSTTLVSKYNAVASQLAGNATEYNFEVGTQINNYGNNNQTAISINATITDPSSAVVYNETLSNLTIASGDSLQIFPGGAQFFPQFSLASYPAGKYTLTYTLSLGVADEYNADNVLTTTFNVQDSIISLAHITDSTNLPGANNGYRPKDGTGLFAQCINFRDDNASRIGTQGLYFSTMATGVDLSGEEIGLYLYRWDDVFTDLNDAALAFDNLTEVASGFYYYPSDLQSVTVYGGFDTPVLFEDGQRYLACVQTFNTALYLGFDTQSDYSWNEAQYLQPLNIINDNYTYYASGFGADVVPAIGIKVFDAAELGVNESASIDGKAYPNPATDVVSFNVSENGNAQINITDLAGRNVKSTSLSFANGTSNMNIADLSNGSYLVTVKFENGKTSQFNIVKK